MLLVSLLLFILIAECPVEAAVVLGVSLIIAGLVVSMVGYVRTGRIAANRGFNWNLCLRSTRYQFIYDNWHLTREPWRLYQIGRGVMALGFVLIWTAIIVSK